MRHPFRLPRRKRLGASRDFERAFSSSKPAKGRLLSVRAAPNGLDHARIGLSVGKGAIRRAVGRNRFKRLCREAFRLNGARLPAGFDLVVSPRRFVDARRLTLAEVARELVHFSRQAASGPAQP